MRENQQATIRRNTKLYSNTKSFKVDDKVWYLCPRLVPGKPSKITDQWLGPYRIMERTAEVLYKIKPADYEGAQLTVHVSRLAKHKGQRDKVRIPKRLQIEDDDETAEEIRPPRVHPVPTSLGVPIMFATPEAEVRDHPRIGGDQLDDGEVPPEADEQEMEEPPKAEQPDILEENLEPMPELDQPLDTIIEDNENKMEIPEVRPKRLRTEEEETYDSTKKLRREAPLTSKLKEGITRAWQQAKELEAGKSEAITQLDNLHVLRVPIKAECTVPRRQTGGSSCYDVCAARSCTLQPGQIEAVPLNLRLAVPRGYTLLLKSRSGLSLKGITTVGGVIDSDYRGPIKALLHNSTKNPFKIKKGQRISQGLFLKHIDVTFEVNDDENFWNDASHYGFGSTG
jgi:dUTP pyrophosphatase